MQGKCVTLQHRRQQDVYIDVLWNFKAYSFESQTLSTASLIHELHVDYINHIYYESCISPRKSIQLVPFQLHTLHIQPP